MNRQEKNGIKGFSMKVGIVVVAILLAGGVVSALDFPGYISNIQNVETLNVSGGELGNFGAITMDKSTFDHGIEILAEGLDIYGGDLDVDVTADFSADVAFSDDVSSTGTTTIRWMDASYQVALDFQQATSTGGVAIEGTQIIPGSVQNTGNDLLCTDVWLDVSTANGIFGSDLKVGTSTSATTTDGHLIADTSLATSTTDIFSKEDDEGTSNTEVWDWNAGEYIIVTQTFDTANCTSSASLTAAGGNAMAGKLHVNCRTRY